MKQALHIFRKDVHRLGAQIAVLMLAIVWWTVLDVRWPAGSQGTGTIAIELIIGAAAWFLIARAVHEESIPDESEFWLTRPYERASLLGAKILMAALAVALPLLLADCAILSWLSLPAGGNLAGLVLRQIVISAWLIAPPFAIASVTRTMTHDVLVWLAGATLAAAVYFPGALSDANDFRAMDEKYALAAAVILFAAALALQYARRGTRTSRAMIAAAILLPALAFPEPAALAIEQWRDSRPLETSRISLAAGTKPVSEPDGEYYTGTSHCAPVPVTVKGAPAGWSVRVLSQKDTFESEGKTWSSGWYRNGNDTAEFAGEGSVSVCARTADLREVESGAPVSARVSLALAVFAPDTPIPVRATLAPFDVPGIGRCQFEPDLQDRYAMACAAPVWLPPPGNVVVAGRETWSSAISRSEYPWTPFGLLPGMSPVLKWVTMPMDKGSPGDVAKGVMARYGLTILIQEGGSIEFRPEKRVAVLRREVTVAGVRFRRD